MREKMIAGMRGTSKAKERRSAAAKARWADPVTGAKLRASLRDPVIRAKRREATKARWADPLMREKMIARMRAAGQRRRRNRDVPDN